MLNLSAAVFLVHERTDKMFIGLHRHSHYSKRDAIAKIPDMVERIGELGQTAWALTDHGTTSGLMEAYRVTQKYNKTHGKNIKFIFGCEMYWVPDIYIKDRKVNIPPHQHH